MTHVERAAGVAPPQAKLFVRTPPARPTDKAPRLPRPVVRWDKAPATEADRRTLHRQCERLAKQYLRATVQEGVSRRQILAFAEELYLDALAECQRRVREVDMVPESQPHLLVAPTRPLPPGAVQTPAGLIVSETAAAGLPVR